MRILLIDNELETITSLLKIFKPKGFDLTIAKDGITGLRYANSRDFQLIILEISIPKLNGLEVCSEIRKTNTEVEILILSKEVDIEDIVEAYRRDADGFMCKPFNPSVLEAKVDRFYRKIKKKYELQKIMIFEDLYVDPVNKKVIRGNQNLELTNTEFRLLMYLLVNKNIVVSINSIFRNVWEGHSLINKSVVYVYINYLRKKIDVNFSNKIIYNVQGQGYVLKINYIN